MPPKEKDMSSKAKGKRPANAVDPAETAKILVPIKRLRSQMGSSAATKKTLEEIGIKARHRHRHRRHHHLVTYPRCGTAASTPPPHLRHRLLAPPLATTAHHRSPPLTTAASHRCISPPRTCTRR